ncbi:hypothetical protein E2C01_089283 [Portunus trituberculatus]|uniref:Uncharacterized protein n=1 Tax=Portunus trituberculatus TaxID=210409 RepID=A0A5B7J8E1_PORTR|nr:hypothetical protein [Portunus trituberculatus]
MAIVPTERVNDRSDVKIHPSVYMKSSHLLQHMEPIPPRHRRTQVSNGFSE